MKSKSLKCFVSLALIIVMMMSVIAVSVVSASAVTNDNSFALTEILDYKFSISTAGTDGESSDKIEIKINGRKPISGEAYSTEWHNVGKVANDSTDSASFSDIAIMNIDSITVKNCGSDGWYPEYVHLTAERIGEPAIDLTFYGGRWVDNGDEVTLALTDKVLKFNVVTSSDSYSGTDADVIVSLYGENNNKIENCNLSDIHPKFNAFEKGDDATFYFAVPSNFGTLKKASFVLDLIGSEDNIFNFGSDWKLGSVDFAFNGDEFNNKKELNKWLSGAESSDDHGPLEIKF